MTNSPYVVHWTPPWVAATIIGTILSIALGIVMILYASHCYATSDWPWEQWLSHRKSIRDTAARERAAEYAHEEAMERIRMGLINEK